MRDPSPRLWSVLTSAAALMMVVEAAPAQASLSKVFVPSTIEPGSTSTLQFTNTNCGGSPVTGPIRTLVLITLLAVAAIWRVRWRA